MATKKPAIPVSRYRETILSPPRKSFESPAHHRFEIGQGKRTESYPGDIHWLETWPILYEGKPAGTLSRNTAHKWGADARGLKKEYAPTGGSDLGFDMFALDTADGAMAAFAAKADAIFKYERERVRYEKERARANARMPKSSCPVLELPRHEFSKRQPDPPGTVSTAARIETNGNVAFTVKRSRKGKDWWVSADQDGYRSSNTLHTSNPATGAYWIEAVRSGRVRVGAERPSVAVQVPAKANSPEPPSATDSVANKVPPKNATKILNYGKGPVCSHPGDRTCKTCSRFHTTQRHEGHSRRA